MGAEISVIIVSWNCRQMLTECIESLRHQLPSNVCEIIVVDNASSDGTATTIRETFPEVKVIESTTNLGFSRGNNLGLEAARGRYLCLINPDVIVGDDCISRMLHYMEQHSDIGMLGPKIVGRDGAVQRSCMRTPTLWNQLCRALALDRLTERSRLFGGYLMNDFKHDTLCDVEIINGCFWMVRRTALNDVGPLDARFWMYADDLDWCRRFRMGGWRIVFFPDAEAVHYGGGSSRHAPLFCFVEMQRADLQYWRKYHGFGSYCLYWALLYFGHALRYVVTAASYVVRGSTRPQAALGLKRHSTCMRRLRTVGRQP